MNLARLQKLASFNKATAFRSATAVVERALLSVSTFLATILLARWGGKAELGMFALFFPMLFVAIALQESLITAPYTVYAAEHSGKARCKYLGGVLIHTILLGLASTLAFAVAAVVLAALRWRLPILGQCAYLCVALAASTPFILIREFARRVVYADLKPEAAVALSGGVSLLQLAMMFGLHFAGWLDAGTAYLAMGALSAIGGGMWLWSNRADFQFRGTPIRPSFMQNWVLGRWIVPTQISEIVRVQMFPWLLALVADVPTVGVYTACNAIANLPTPLQIALSNMILPEFVQVNRKSGVRAANRLMWQATWWMAALMTAFVATVLIVSQWLVPALYGPQFLGTAHPLIVLTLSQWFYGVSIPSGRALLVLRRPDQVCWSQFGSIVVNLAFGWPLVVKWGVVGAAYAALFAAGFKALLGLWWYDVEMRRQMAIEQSESGELMDDLDSPAAPDADDNSLDLDGVPPTFLAPLTMAHSAEEAAP